MKYCVRCKLEKSYAEFYKSTVRRDGYTRLCMACHREDVRKYARTEKGKVTTNSRTYRMIDKYPERKSARVKVRTAVRSGKLIKPTQCEGCSQEKSLQGHHDDYSKPLDVKWLCDTCHKLLHGRLVDKTLLEESKEK